MRRSHFNQSELHNPSHDLRRGLGKLVIRQFAQSDASASLLEPQPATQSVNRVYQLRLRKRSLSLHLFSTAATMTITESTRQQLFEMTNGVQVIRMDQKRHASLEANASTAASPFALGTWTVKEHHLFLEALELYPSGPWKRVAQHIGSRTPRQVMTHAQKYRQRLQRRAATTTTTTTRVKPDERPRTASKNVQTGKILSVVVSPMPTLPTPAVTADEMQVEANICVLPAMFEDELPTYGHFPFLDEFLAQLVTDSMFDGVDMTLPDADIEPLQF